MRHHWKVAVVVGLLGALAACGSDETDGSATVPSSTTPPATAAPTTTPPATDAATTVAPTTVAPTTSVASGDVSAMLLTVDDVWAGWQEASPVGEADFDDSWQIPCDDVAINPTFVDVLRPSAGIQFEPSDGSYRHLMQMVTTGAADELAPALDAYIGAVTSCGSEALWFGAVVTVDPLDLGELGDQRAAYTVVASEGDGSNPMALNQRTASVRVGDHVVTLGLVEVLEGEGAELTVSDAQFVDLVRTAVAKFG